MDLIRIQNEEKQNTKAKTHKVSDDSNAQLHKSTGTSNNNYL